jgi:type II secretory pathway component PulK
MTDQNHFDETASLATMAERTHAEWQELRDDSSSGQKAWLTQMKNHYARLIQADASAAAEVMAMQEHRFSLVRRLDLSAIAEK